MAEQSGFFDAHLVNGEYDRVYLSEHFAKYFASFIGNGIFGGKSNELMVRERGTPSMGVRVLSGQAWIDGYWYENTDELPLAIDIADGVLHRIDSIVVRWNHSERTIRLAVKKGTAATNPVAPVLQRDDDYYELKLADVHVNAGATNITQANIYDTRLNTDVCGLVIGVVQQLDTEEFGIQLDAFIQEFIAEHDEWYKQTQTEVDAWAESMKSVYNAWYANFKTTSEQNVNAIVTKAQTDIANLISTGSTNINKVVSDGTANINKLISDKTTEINEMIAESEGRVDTLIQNANDTVSNFVAEGNAEIDAALAQNKTAVDALLASGQSNINKVVTDGQAVIDELIETKEAEVDTLISESETRINNVIEDLERIAEENDVAGLVTDVANLKTDMTAVKGVMVESADYRGCYYRVFQEEVEWINPPNQPGVAYRTTERWNNKAVYQKILYAASLPNKTIMSVFVDSAFDAIISITGFAIDSDNNMHYPFPIILNGLMPVAVISQAEGDGGAGSDITINTNEDLSSFKAYITVKYTKA